MINTIELNELADGQLKSWFEAEFEGVIDNIQDPNTPPEAVRSITITLSFKPDKTRSYSSAKVEVKSKLAKQAPIETAITIGTVNGKPKVSEYVVVNQTLDFNAV